MAAVVAEEEQAPVMGEEAVMGEEEQTLSLVMEEREPARSEEAEAEEPYTEVTGETGVVEGVVVEEAPLTNETLRDWAETLVRRRARGPAAAPSRRGIQAGSLI